MRHIKLHLGSLIVLLALGVGMRETPDIPELTDDFSNAAIVLDYEDALPESTSHFLRALGNALFRQGLFRSGVVCEPGDSAGSGKISAGSLYVKETDDSHIQVSTPTAPRCRPRRACPISRRA